MRLRFTVLLPALAMILWATLFFIPAFSEFMRIAHASGKQDPVRMTSGQFTAVIPRARLFSFLLYGPAIHHGMLLTGLNLPGRMALSLVSLALTRQATWCPSGYLFQTWSCLLIPFDSLVFWWIAGIGLDAGFEHRRLPRLWLLTGTLCCLIFAVLALAFRFGISVEERKEMTVPLWGFALWAVLLAPFVVGWFFGLNQVRS